MITQHSDPPRERTDTDSEVLSDATDLDALLEAILGDQVAPLPPQSRPSDESTGRTVAAAARPEPAVVAPLRAEGDPDDPFALRATADHKAEWGFVSEGAEDENETARDVGAVPQDAPASLVPPVSRPWRDKLRGSLSKRSLIVAALSAIALILASAMGLRDARTETATLPSSGAPALVQGSPVEPPSAVKVTGPSEVEVWAAAREPKEPPRVISRTPRRRTNEVTDQRSNTPPKPVIEEAPQSALTASPVVASPAPVERIGEPTDRGAATGRTATPEGAKPRPVDSEPTDAAARVGVTNGAAPAPAAAAAAPVPAGLPRQTAPRLLTGSAPEYPAALRTAKIGGSVEVRFTIDRSGRVINVQSSSGPLQLRSAAEAAVRRWRYEAARVDNLAVETQTSIRFNFDPSTTRRPQE